MEELARETERMRECPVFCMEEKLARETERMRECSPERMRECPVFCIRCMRECHVLGGRETERMRECHVFCMEESVWTR